MTARSTDGLTATTGVNVVVIDMNDSPPEFDPVRAQSHI